MSDIEDPREEQSYDSEEGLKVNWSSEEFSLKGKVQLPPKFWYILIAVLCASLGVSYEEIMEVVGI
jgi:DNA/RNA endonuclease G (NUC1)|tara:strand:+ start:1965 stop:2162 length:198 start_codon:yes stop_codon:yes gene_type:complete